MGVDHSREEGAEGDDVRFEERYLAAVASSNLRSEQKTFYSSSDVLGAAGIASKCQPMAIALIRLFSGDNHAAAEILALLAQKLVSKAHRDGVRMSNRYAVEISAVTLDWFRDGRCKACRGLGFQGYGEHRPCKACGGARRREFEPMFEADHVEIARWLLTELEREVGVAEPTAMKALKPRELAPDRKASA